MSYIAVGLCLLAIVARIIWPEISFDGVSLKLLLTAVIILVFPEIRDLISKIRRVKKGNLEIELAEQVTQLVKDTSKLEINSPFYSEISEKILERIAKTSSEPRGALMLISIEIESRIRRLAEGSGAPNINQTSVVTLLNELTKRGRVPEEIDPIFREFWSIRNKLAQQFYAQISSAKLYAIVDLGIRILKWLPDPDDSVRSE